MKRHCAETARMVLPDTVEPAPRQRLARSTAIFSAATGLSRALGLVREIVAAYLFGVSGKINALHDRLSDPEPRSGAGRRCRALGCLRSRLQRAPRTRRTRPRLARRLDGLLARLADHGRPDGALHPRAPAIIGLFGEPGGDADLAVGLSRVLFPIVVFLGLSGVIVGVLNAYDHFTVPALAPVAWNAVIVLGLVLGVPAADGEDAELYVYAGSILIATLVQLPAAGALAAGLDGRLRVALDWRDPAVRRIFA